LVGAHGYKIWSHRAIFCPYLLAQSDTQTHGNIFDGEAVGAGWVHIKIKVPPSTICASGILNMVGVQFFTFGLGPA
jgi:hypothetical protein